MIYIVVERCQALNISKGLTAKNSVKVFEKLSLAQDYYESKQEDARYVYPIQSLKVNFHSLLYLLVCFEGGKAEVMYGTPYKKNLKPVMSYLESTQNKNIQVFQACS